MMKRLIKLAVLSAIILSFASTAIAGESVSIKVSCVIPAIPGVNAPPYPSEEIRQAQEGGMQISGSKERRRNKTYRRRKEERTEVAYITEEEAVPEDNLKIETTQATDTQATRTVYSR